MAKYCIGTFNKISPLGLDRFGENYEFTEDQEKANAFIVRSYKMHEMEFSRELLAIGRAGAGVNNIPVDRCSEEGIVVFNAPGANSNAVKELVLASMIMGARNIYEGVTWANTLEGDVAAEVETGKKQFAGSEIFGKTLGIVGIGQIGYKVANAAYALGMNIVGMSAVVHPGLNVPCEIYDTIEEMAPQCDYITVHVPSLPETKGMINKELIASMKDGVVLINCARPDLIVEDDILEAVKSGKIKKYITDLPSEKLIRQENIITIPHLGASTSEAEDNCAVMVAEQVKDFFENGNIKNSVNFPPIEVEHIPGTNRVSFLFRNESNVRDSIMARIDKEQIVKLVGKEGRFGYGAAIAVLKEDTDIKPLLELEGGRILRVRAL